MTPCTRSRRKMPRERASISISRPLFSYFHFRFLTSGHVHAYFPSFPFIRPTKARSLAAISLQFPRISALTEVEELSRPGPRAQRQRPHPRHDCGAQDPEKEERSGLEATFSKGDVFQIAAMSTYTTSICRARNAEKAMTALARFRQAQLEEGKVKERRPFLASECTELPKAEKWRRQIIGEISKKVAQIQNAGLGEFRIRDLNDEINKLLREKGHWEVRIKELGGPDYGKVGPKMLDHEGKEVPGNRGYKYFGAAKDLPGVRELFEKEPLPPPRKTRAELMKAIDFEYYGYLDEDDGVIVPLEQEHEKKLRAELVERWKAERAARLARGEEEQEDEEDEEEVNIYAVAEEESDEEGSQEKGGEDGPQKFIAHVPVPSQQEIEEALVRRKKMELLQKYASETLQAQSEEAKRLLGY
ncbi:pre-mRNA-splicing factor ISY1 homolog [Ctenodactylus gundi]